MKTETVKHAAYIDGGSLVVTTTKQIVIPNPGALVTALVGDRVQPLSEEALQAILLDTARPRLRRAKGTRSAFTDAGSALESQLGRKKSRRLAKLLRKYGIAAVNRVAKNGKLEITTEQAIAANTAPDAIKGTSAANLLPEQARIEALSKLSPAKRVTDYLDRTTSAEIVDLPKGAQAVIAVTDRGLTFAVAPTKPAYNRRGGWNRKA